MTDSEKLDAILKMVREIREYVGAAHDCPQHLWNDARVSQEALRQLMSQGCTYEQAMERLQRR